MIFTQAGLLHKTITVLEQLQIRYLICGSFASSTFGEPRMTLDIDIVVQLTQSQGEELCSEFPAPDFYVSLAAAREAISGRRQFNVIHPETGNKVDFMVAGDDEWSQSQVDRAHRTELLPGVEGFVSSPEDVVISKMRYYQEGGSEKHLRDCAGVLTVRGDQIDRSYIVRWAVHFGSMEVWEAILQRVRHKDQS